MDGNHMTDVRARVVMAHERVGKVRNIWSSRWIPLSLKLQIYVAGVCSVLVYGSDTWTLDGEATMAINGAILRARITDKSIREEARDGTRSYGLMRQIRARRAQYLGHILRIDPARMVHKAMRYMHENRVQGDLLMDAPSYSWPELVELAADRDQWRSIVNAVKGPSVKVTLGVV